MTVPREESPDFDENSAVGRSLGEEGQGSEATANENNDTYNRPKTAEQQSIMNRIYGYRTSNFEATHKSFKAARFFRGGTQAKSQDKKNVNVLRRSHPPVVSRSVR